MLIRNECKNHPWMIIENGTNIPLTNDLALVKMQESCVEFSLTGNIDGLIELSHDLLRITLRFEDWWWDHNQTSVRNLFRRINSATDSIEQNKMEEDLPTRNLKRKRINGW